MNGGLVIRLAGPLQSWGTSSAFAERDTAAFPTRSGLVGMFASALGMGRGEPLDRFAGLRLVVRVDDPGVPLVDFHTVGGGLPAARTVPTAAGGRRPGDTGTIVSRRRYLSGAAFTVAAAGPDALLGEIAAALAAPRRQPYLGRRSCPPDAPLLLAAGVGDPEADLRERVPLARRPGAGAGGPTPVDLYADAGPGEPADVELPDTPASFAPTARSHLPRRVRREALAVDPTLCHPPGDDFLEALYAYMREAA